MLSEQGIVTELVTLIWGNRFMDFSGQADFNIKFFNNLCGVLYIPACCL